MSYRRLILFGSFMLILLLPLYLSYNHFARLLQQTGVKRPDVLVISIDTCRYDALGSYGNNRVYTPYMDNLVRKGVQFQRGYAPIPTTGPSHTTMFTGRSPGTHGVFRNAMRYSGRYVTLAKLLKDTGYRTGAFVSGYSVTSKPSGLDPGFDFYDDTWSQNKLERDAKEVIKSCKDWLTEDHETPYFAWLHLFDPHSPYQEREPIIKSIRSDTGRKKVEAPEYTDDQINKYRQNVDQAIEAKDFMVLVKHPMSTETDPETLEKHYSAYLSEVSYVDQQLSELNRFLQAEGRWNRTLVFLTADHGEGFDHDYFFAHGDRLWESAVRVPWIVRLPFDINGKNLSRAIARHEDIFPTVMSYCNIDFPIPGLEGYDLSNTIAMNLAGRTPAWSTIAPPLPRKSVSQGLVTAAYDPHFKLIRTGSSEREKLFFLTKDPGELDDVSHKYPKVKERLSKRLDHLIRKSRIPSVEMTVQEREQEDQLKALGYIQ